MSKVVSTANAVKIARKLRKNHKTIVLVGGCFDLLHIGHVRFLEAAKQKGDILMVLLEHDDAVRKQKGSHRPINSQQDRAEVLSALWAPSYIVLLPHLKNDDEYDNLIFSIKPAIIATTKADPNRSHKERQAHVYGITVVDVIERIQANSSTQVLETLKKSS